MQGDLDVKHYKENVFVQFQLAEDVLDLYTFRGDSRVAQIISEKIPPGQIEGINPSLAMIQLAFQ